jgi:uncharacterized protein YjbI with pentapeptide repeats
MYPRLSDWFKLRASENLQSANSSSGFTDLKRVNFNGTNLIGVDFEHVDLKKGAQNLTTNQVKTQNFFISSSLSPQSIS